MLIRVWRAARKLSEWRLQVPCAESLQPPPKKIATFVPRRHQTLSDRAFFHLLHSCKEKSLQSCVPLWGPFTQGKNLKQWESVLCRWDTGVRGGMIIVVRAVLNPICTVILRFCSERVQGVLWSLLPPAKTLEIGKPKPKNPKDTTANHIHAYGRTSSSPPGGPTACFREHESAAATNYLYLNQKKKKRLIFRDESKMWVIVAPLLTGYLKWCSQGQPRSRTKHNNPMSVPLEVWWQREHSPEEHCDGHAKSFLKARICPLCHQQWIIPRVAALGANSLIWGEVGL